MSSDPLMSQIPEDVMQRAKEAMASVIDKSPMGYWTSAEIREAVARAILSDRSSRSIAETGEREPTPQTPLMPIEMAPKDGTWFLAYREAADCGTWDRFVVVRWHDEFSDFIWPDQPFDIFNDDIDEIRENGFHVQSPYEATGTFTAWCPLPAHDPSPQQHVSGIDWSNPEDPVVKLFVGYDVEGYVEHYEFVGDDGEYSPNEKEKTLIDDAIRGVICELHEQLQKIVPSTPSPETHVKGDPDLTMLLHSKADSIRKEYQLAYGRPCNCSTPDSALHYGRAQGLEMAADIAGSALATEGRLTVADIETLKACDDWKATFEVIAIRRLPSSADSYRAEQQRIDALLERGLLEFGRPNTTYRITPAGRAALATEGK